MSPTSAEIALVLVAAIPIVWVLWAIIDVVLTPGEVWRSAGHSQPVMLLMLVVFTVLGAILYSAVIRPRLKKARRAMQA